MATEDESVNIEQVLLSHIASAGEISDTWEFAAANSLDHQAVVGAVKSLLVDAYVADEPLSNTFWTLTDEGREIASKGSPEFQLYSAVPEGGRLLTELQAELPDAVKIGLGPCMKNKWLKKQGDSVLRIAESVRDETADYLNQVSGGSSSVSEEELKNLKRRKLVQQVIRKSYKVTKGECFRPQRVRRMADLTKDMLGSKSEVSVLFEYHC